MEQVTIDWKKIVSESNGRSHFLPESIKADAEKWQETRVDFDKKVATLAQQEIEISVMLQNMMLAIRKYLAENGHADVWTKDIGFDENALKEGVFIINITDPNANPLLRR